MNAKPMRLPLLACMGLLSTAPACGRISGLDDLHPTGSTTTGAASGSTTGSGGGSTGVGGSASSASSTNGSGGMVSTGGGGAGGSAATYADLVLESHPIAYWRLGETQSQLTAKDASPSGFDGTYFMGVQRGAPGAIVGDDDTGIRFVQDCPDGEEAMGVDVPDKDALDFAGNAPFTLEAWIRPTCLDPLDNVQRRIVYKEDPAGMGYKLNLSGDHRLFFTRTGMTNDDYIYGPTPLEDQWNYVAVRYDGTQCLIIDNFESNVATCNAGMAATTVGLRIGASSNGNQPFAGDIDEVAIYDEALDTEVLEHHRAIGMATRQ